MHANLFHVDVKGIAPASVGLGMGPMALNPLVRKLRDLTVQAVEASEENSSSSCNDDPVLPVLVLSSAPRLSTEAVVPQEQLLQVVSLYQSFIREQALVTWSRGIPHFYTKHRERKSLLLSLLHECSSKGVVEEWKYYQLDLLCARLALPDLAAKFLPEESKSEEESNENFSETLPPSGDQVKMLLPPAAPVDISDEALLLSSSHISESFLLVPGHYPRCSRK